MGTIFDSMESLRRYLSVFAEIPINKLTLKEVVFREAMRKKIRHNLVSPRAFTFTAPGGREHTIVVDNYRDGLACWLIEEKRFARRL